LPSREDTGKCTEPDEWRALVIVLVALGSFLDLVIAPWLVVLDATILLAGVVYLLVRRRRDSSGA